MARTSKGFCAASRASSGQNKGNTMTFQRQKRLNRTYEDKPTIVLGQAQDKKRTYEGQHPRENAILLAYLLVSNSLCERVGKIEAWD